MIAEHACEDFIHMFPWSFLWEVFPEREKVYVQVPV